MSDTVKVGRYECDVTWDFWRHAGRLRNNMDEQGSFHWRRARAMERAAAYVAKSINVLWIDLLCEPWFDGSAFQ